VKVATSILTIVQENLRTSEGLLADNATSGAEKNADKEKYLIQKEAVLEVEGREKTIPFVILETQAQLDSALARLEQSRHDLEHTKIVCPFNARVESVSAGASQFVTAHISIATLIEAETLEISVVVDPRDLRWIDKEVCDYASGHDDTSSGNNRLKTDATPPAVKVSWTVSGQKFQWSGRVTRFVRMDEATRTAQVVVEVRNVDVGFHFGGDGSKVQLALGMFCRTDIPAQPFSDALVVPRHAIYDDQWVYVFEPGEEGNNVLTGRLGIRRVPILRSVGGDVLVHYGQGDGASREPCELVAGDRVIVSPLVKPVLGMKVRLGVGGESVAMLNN